MSWQDASMMLLSVPRMHLLQGFTKKSSMTSRGMGHPNSLNMHGNKQMPQQAGVRHNTFSRATSVRRHSSSICCPVNSILLLSGLQCLPGLLQAGRAGQMYSPDKLLPRRDSPCITSVICLCRLQSYQKQAHTAKLCYCSLCQPVNALTGRAGADAHTDGHCAWPFLGFVKQRMNPRGESSLLPMKALVHG